MLAPFPYLDSINDIIVTKVLKSVKSDFISFAPSLNFTRFLLKQQGTVMEKKL